MLPGTPWHGGLTRGFQLLPSAPQSWDRSHCIVPKVHGVQYVQSEVHPCWHCGTVVACSVCVLIPLLPPVCSPAPLLTLRRTAWALEGRGPVRTRALMVLHCMCITMAWRQSRWGVNCIAQKHGLNQREIRKQIIHMPLGKTPGPQDSNHPPGAPERRPIPPWQSQGAQHVKQFTACTGAFMQDCVVPVMTEG